MGSTRALIMAGGKSERMRASGVDTHKALARVCGVTLLEWNLRLLLNFGFHDIVAAVSSEDTELSECVSAALLQSAARAGVITSVYAERTPLGNIGAAREVVGDADNVLVLYVDNLTSIDVRSLVEFHERENAALTIATHCEPFTVPYGNLTLEGNRVLRYTEKPTLQVQVSSGTCVLSKRACELIPRGRPLSASELFALLVERNEIVGAFEHADPWIDINDALALARAHTLVAEHFGAFTSAMPK